MSREESVSGSANEAAGLDIARAIEWGNRNIWDQEVANGLFADGKTETFSYLFDKVDHDLKSNEGETLLSAALSGENETIIRRVLDEDASYLHFNLDAVGPEDDAQVFDQIAYALANTDHIWPFQEFLMRVSFTGQRRNWYIEKL